MQNNAGPTLVDNVLQWCSFPQTFVIDHIAINWHHSTIFYPNVLKCSNVKMLMTEYHLYVRVSQQSSSSTNVMPLRPDFLSPQQCFHVVVQCFHLFFSILICPPPLFHGSLPHFPLAVPRSCLQFPKPASCNSFCHSCALLSSTPRLRDEPNICKTSKH